MKATGIVRRVDDLGRIVIPKEIRRTLRIREGDPLEIYTEKDGGVTIVLATFHQTSQFPGIGFVHQFPLRRSGQGNDRIPIRYRRNSAGVAANGFTDLCGKILQIAHRRVLAENHTAILFRVNLQRVAFSNLEGSSDFFGNNNTA